MTSLDSGCSLFFFFQAEDGIRDVAVTGVQTCALPISGFGRALDAAVFVAHNARFDWRFLAAEYALAGVPAPGGKPLCTVRLTRRLVPELRHRALDHVAPFFGIENPARHRAFGDALATPHVLRARASPKARDRKSTRLNSSHGYISYAVFCLKKKKKKIKR